MKLSKLAFSVIFVTIGLLGFAQSETIEWLTWEEALEKQAKTPKKVIVDVYTDWCGWCKKMDKETFQNKQVAQYINQHYYAIKFNAESKKTVVIGTDTFNFNSDYGRRGAHELATTLLNNRMSYPSVAYLDETFNIIQVIPGYYSSTDIEPILKFISQNLYKDTKWVDFIANFSGSF